MTVEEAKDAITKKVVSLGVGREKVNYRIREWIFARQRYWGEPIPIIHMEDGQDVLLDDSELPLILPELEDYKGRNGVSPLEAATDWVNVIVDGKKGKRETSTMPGSAGSSWYFLRYIDPDNEKELANKELLKHWMPVDLYVGGPEHAVGHLLYSRMWNNYLYDKGIVPVAEPFKKLVHQGMVLGSNGIKMGKRFPEYSVNPNDIIEQYGADTLRFYEMFMGPLEADKPWSTQGVEGAHRFLERVWRLYESGKIKDEENKNLEKVYNQTVKKVTEDFETLNFNTAISQMMIFINAVYKEEIYPKVYAENFIKLLNPIAPFMTEELWEKLGHNNTITYEAWPVYDEAKIVDDEITIAVQVNGKVRGTIRISKDEEQDIVKDKATNEENVKRHLEGLNIVKIIVVPNKIVNIIAK
jgi:leucyl-tRNA synthetase